MGIFDLFNDKNKTLNNQFISDVLIHFTLKLIGKSEHDASEIFMNHFQLKTPFSDAGGGINQVVIKLSNGCILGAYSENNKIYKVIIWLNNKPSKKDLENLKIWQVMHQSEYHPLINTMDCFEQNGKSYNKNCIAFESKLY